MLNASDGSYHGCTMWLRTLFSLPAFHWVTILLLRCPYECCWQLALIMVRIVLYRTVGLRGSSAPVDPAGRRSALLYLEVVRLAVLASSASRRNLVVFSFSTSCVPAKSGFLLYNRPRRNCLQEPNNVCVKGYWGIGHVVNK